MREFFCITCNYVWHDLDHEGCPECCSTDVISVDKSDDVQDYDGHFEGSFLGHMYDNDLGD